MDWQLLLIPGTIMGVAAVREMFKLFRLQSWLRYCRWSYKHTKDPRVLEQAARSADVPDVAAVSPHAELADQPAIKQSASTRVP